MEGKGQYIYAHVLAQGVAAEVGEGRGGEVGEPTLKFNNGHFGGESTCLFSHSQDPQGMLEAVYADAIKPVLEAALQVVDGTAPAVPAAAAAGL